MTLDSRAEELLHAIRDNPDDDAPRLVFADHIADRWPGHAAWIVAQCTGKTDETLRDAFLDELPPPLRKLTTHRGFADVPHWKLDVGDFTAIDPDVLFRLAPACSRIELSEVMDYDMIAARMQRFDALALRDTKLTITEARELARARGLAHLRALEIRRSEIDDAAVSELLASACFHGLERLVVNTYHSRIATKPTWSTIRRVAHAPFAGTLRALDLTSGNYKDIVELVAMLPVLRELGAADNRIDTRIAKVPRRLFGLDIRSCGAGDDVVLALAQSDVLAEATAFNGMANPWSPEALARWIAARTCGPLRVLQLGSSGFTNGELIAMAIAQSHLPATLETLVLSMDLGRAGATYLSRTAFANLRELTVGDLTPKGLTALARSSWFRQLRRLELYGRGDVDRGSARALVDALGPNARLYVLSSISDWKTQELLEERLGDRLEGV